MSTAWIGLTLSFAAAVVTNTAYSVEHDAAATLPPLSPLRPVDSAKLLLRERRWMAGFAAESAGWLMYVAALQLAPLALVQAIGASGVAVLAFATARGHPSRLAPREQLAVVLAAGGLALLSLSLVGAAPSDRHPPLVGLVIWLAACGGLAVLLVVRPVRGARAASLGLAAGLLFADGDISCKLVGYGGPWLAATATLIVGYGMGTTVLQSAYQHGDALTAAGTAMIVTNAVPMTAGFVLFGETLPEGNRAILQVAAFVCLVTSGAALAGRQAPQASAHLYGPLSALQKPHLPPLPSWPWLLLGMPAVRPQKVQPSCRTMRDAGVRVSRQGRVCAQRQPVSPRHTGRQRR